MKKTILFLVFATGLFTSGSIKAQTLRRDISLSDPFVMADAKTKKYYMTGTGGQMWTSSDLEVWTGPKTVIQADGAAWMGASPQVWASEVYALDGKYYNISTFTNDAITIDESGHSRRAVHILSSNLPGGTYKLMSGGDATYLPAEKSTLDGTLFIDTDGTRYLIYCHEWIQNDNGTVEAIRLKDDMSGTVGKPTILFRAHDATWNTGAVTDGPFAFRTQTGRLGMLWTSWHGDRYVQGVAYSTTGSITGLWRQEALPVTPDDYGHGMLFRTFDGQLLMSIHSHRNIDLDKQWFERHPTLFLCDDSGDKLRVLMEYKTNIGLGNPANVVVANPEFNYGKQGWTCTTQAQNQLIAHNQGGAITGNFFESWDANSYTGEIYQELNALPAGTYRVSAAAFRNSVITGGTAGADVVKLFANDQLTSVTSNDPERFSVVTTVTDGRLRFGIRSEQKNYKWMGIDNVRIEYFGSEEYTSDQIERAIRNEAVYLRNQRDGRFLNAGQSWGTQAVLAEHPMDFYLVELPSGRYALDSRLSNGGANHYVGANGYLDGAMTEFRINWKDNQTVTLSTDGSHYWGNTGAQLVSTQLTNTNTKGAQWNLLRYDDLMALLKDATPEEPADATFLIQCPNFGRNDTRLSAWQGDVTTGGDVKNQCAEAPSGTFDIYQTITGIPDGFYEVRVQGFYRGVKTLLYANQTTQPLMKIADETGSQPTSLDDACERFTAGKYQNNLRVEVTDGSLTLGIKKTSSASSWTVFDNFELYYLGAENPIVNVHSVRPNEDTPAMVYDLTGRRVLIRSNPHLPGFCIIRKGEKVQKIFNKGIIIQNGKKIIR
ncbi:MAG: family 43 glycosylhydrolase [Bacteroidaceae bacterium]|nr:family 43 glycosylhydrolase [Bacteroidaceae bacterium]